MVIMAVILRETGCLWVDREEVMRSKQVSLVGDCLSTVYWLFHSYYI